MKRLHSSIKTGAVLAALAFAAGCSGGGSSPSAPRPIASAPASGGTLPSSFGKSNASATIRIKSRTSAKRAIVGTHKRAYISPATQGLIATFVDNANNTTDQGFTLQANTSATAQSPATCGAPATDGSYTCTLYFSLTSTASPYTTTLTTYDAAQSGTSGTPVAAQGATSAIALSTATQQISVVANEANNFSFTLSGIVEAFEATPQYIGVAAVPNPTATPFSTTFHALDGDFYLIDAVDQTTPFAYGTQPTGPFTSPAPFAVAALDESSSTCSTAPCVALASPSPVIADPTTEGIGFTYNGAGESGDGVDTAPYYGLIGVTGPMGYSGNTSATIGGTPYAATAYVVPFFGIVDPANTVQRVDASDVSFTNPSDTVNVYALQYHLPDNDTAGYSIDTSACGSIATAAAGTPLASGYGESFTLSSGGASGTCSVTLSDGAGDTATINVTSTAAGGTNVTVPCSSATLAPDARRLHRKTRSAAVITPCGATTLFVSTNQSTITSYALSSLKQTAVYTASAYGLAVDPVQGKLYAGSDGQFTVFNIGNTTPVTTKQADMFYEIAVDPQGSVFVDNQDLGYVLQFAANDLNAPPVSVAQDSSGSLFSLAFDPASRELFVGNYGSGTVKSYAAANLQSVVKTASGLSFPDALAAGNGRFYVLENDDNYDSNATIGVYDEKTFGLIATIPNIDDYSSIAIDASGGYLYVCGYITGNVNRYSLSNLAAGPTTLFNVGAATANGIALQ